MKIEKTFNKYSLKEIFYYIDNYKKYTNFNTLGLYRSIVENEKLDIEQKIELREYANNLFYKTFDFLQLKDPHTFFCVTTLGKELTIADERQIWNTIISNQEKILKKKRIKHRNFGDYSKHNCGDNNCIYNGIMIKQGSFLSENNIHYISDKTKRDRKEKSKRYKRERKTNFNVIDNEQNIFNTYWKQEFTDLLPFGHDLRYHFPERWFRVHSLQKSKRYANTAEEYQTIFERQNELFETIIGKETEILLVFGLCTNDITNDNYFKIIDCNEFEKVKTIDLHQMEPQNYDKNIILTVYTNTVKWHKNGYNKILKAIADDEIRMLFICPSKKRIIVPYDGGVDVIMENELARNKMKNKFKNWLSDREDGL